jgi:hypothetical protein
MPKHRLFAEDGSDLGETRLAVHVGPGDPIHVGAETTLRVIDMVAVDEPDSPYTGFLRVRPDLPTNGYPAGSRRGIICVASRTRGFGQ